MQKTGWLSFNAALLAACSFVLIATPVKAASTLPSPTAPKHVALPKQVAPRPLDLAWDNLLKKTEAKLKPGMTNDQVTGTMVAAQKTVKGGAVFDTSSVEEFVLPGAKRRVTVSLAYFRTDVRTPHALLLAFDAPIGDFRGASAKLLKVTLTSVPTPPIAVLRALKPETVATYHEINQKTHYKFPTAY
jgi:hypothetical protein